MNSKQLGRFSIFLILAFVVYSCRPKNKEAANDKNHGSVVITADSNLHYILEQLVPVYENFYPGTKVSFNYTSEDVAVNDFKHKKNTIIAIGRLLSTEEMANAAHNHDAKILENTFAYDAIAVIASKSFKDSVFILEKTASYLDSNSPVKLVFDNTKSGIAKSILQLSGTAPDAFKSAYSLASVSEVLKYVAANSNAIGFIPYNLLSNRNEKQAREIRTAYKFLAVSYHDTITSISQESIAYHTYPLMRPISIYIGNCPELVGQGFTHFLFKRQIQKVLLLSGLVPRNIPTREVNVTDEFNPSK